MSWPLKIQLQVTLLNQISNDQHHSCLVRFSKAIHERKVFHRVLHKDMAETGWGYGKFVSHETLRRVTTSCQFLKNDCVFIRVCNP